MSDHPTPITDALRARIPEPRAIQDMIASHGDLECELAEAREQRDRLAEALKMFKAEGPDSNACFCDAQFAMHGAHPRHTDECIAATEALAAVEGGAE